MKRKTAPDLVELTPEGWISPSLVSREDSKISAHQKYILHLKNLSCPKLVRKHDVIEARPE